MFRHVSLCLVLMAAMAASLAAQGIAGRPARKGPPPPGRIGRQAALIERWNNMTPEQRRRALDRVPPERRRRIEEQLEFYQNLSPEERRELRFRSQMFNQLSPERQDEARRLFRQYNLFPPDRQARLREEFQQLRAMPEPERRARLDSDEFHQTYTPREQRFLGAFSRLLAPPTSDPPPPVE